MEEKQWFLYVSDHHEGPFTLDEVKKILKKGEARSTSYVWREGFEDWIMMSDLPDFEMPGAVKGEGHGEPSFLMSPPSILKDKFVAPATFKGPAVPTVSVNDVKNSDAVFCLNSNRTYTGPHSLKNLIRKINDRDISVKDKIWREGWVEFVTLETVIEVMKEVKGDILDPSLVKNKVKTKGAKTIGIGSGVSVPKYKVWKGGIFLFFTFIFLPICAYQYIAKGGLPELVAKTPLKDRKLTPLPLDAVIDTALGFAAQLPEKLAPVINLATEYAPESLLPYLSPIGNIENMDAEKLQIMRIATRRPLATLPSVVAFRTNGDDFNPEFYIASNFPDGTNFVVSLNGKPGTLLNAKSYSKTVFVEIQKKLGKTIKFAYDGNKPLPRGEYILTVYDAELQAEEVAKALAVLPNVKGAPAGITGNHKFYSMEPVFLGGKNDNSYKARLAEYNLRLAEKKNSELQELKQMIALMESNASEDSKKYSIVAVIKNLKQKRALWQQHSARFLKMSQQMQATLNKSPDVLSKDYLEGDLYVKTAQLEALLVGLHHQRSNILELNSLNPGPRLREGETQFMSGVAAVKETLNRELSLAAATIQSQAPREQTPPATTPAGTAQ